MKLREAILRLLNISVLVILFLNLNSCKEKDLRLKYFNEFLTAHDVDIIKTTHYYIIFSKYGCQTCYNSLLPVFLETVSERNVEDFTFIIANQKEYPLIHQLKYKIINDTKGDIDLINMDISNFTIIKTEDAIIKDSWNFSLAQVDEFLLFLKEEF